MDPYSRRVGEILRKDKDYSEREGKPRELLILATACSTVGITFFEVLEDYVSTGEVEAIFFAQQSQYEYDMRYTAIQGESTLREHLPTLVFDNTTLTKAEKYYNCILNPLRVLDLLIPWGNDFLGNYTNRHVPLSAGYIRHYRNPFLGAFSTNTWPIIQMSGTFQTIKYPEHLMGQLFQNVQRRLDRVYKSDLMIDSTQPNCQCNTTANP
ncbi:unnamed protein product [Nippostrongylus brasiliensis]|uniref:Glycosyltransferase family 92 protein n=1 Tax=Nippostrongylus brasiliensis TaxID=27835 RepID=A0A0N4XWI5_NIPBR|nr:unnamed protein product [Nippostrongylus brasiliensis]